MSFVEGDEGIGVGTVWGYYCHCCAKLINLVEVSRLNE